MSENLIPVTDVTSEAEFKAAHEQALAAAHTQLESGEQFVVITMPKDGVRVTALAGRQEMEQALYGLLSTYGAELLGPSGDNLPDSVRDVIKVATGIAQMNKIVQAMMAPRTPAGDAGDTQH